MELSTRDSRDRAIKIGVGQMVKAQGFREGDCFVTLTFKPGYRADRITQTKDLEVYLRHLSHKVFGKRFRKKRRQLKCFPVFERSHRDGWHIHMLMERPNDSRLNSAAFDDAVKGVWTRMHCGGTFETQDIRPITDPERLIRYLTKQSQSNGEALLDRIDFGNCTLH